MASGRTISASADPVIVAGRRQRRIVTVLIRALVACAMVMSTVVAATAPASAATGQLHGRVSDGGGAPLGGATVTVLLPDTLTAVATAGTESDGTYEIEVEDGTYDISVDPPSASGLNQQTFEDFTISGSTSLNVVLVPSAVRFSGVLRTDRGVPVPGKQVRLFGESSASVLTGVDGAFSLSVAPGTYGLSVTTSCCLDYSDDYPEAFRFDEPGLLELTEDRVQDLTVPLSMARTTVLGPDGAPVSGVVVQVGGNYETRLALWEGGPTLAALTYTNTQAVTGADGVATVPLLPHDDVTLTATPPVDRALAQAAVTGLDARSDTNTIVAMQATQPTSLALVSSVNPSTFDQTVVLTATVTSTNAPPVGSVRFTADGEIIDGCGAVAIGEGEGIAQCEVSSLAVGTHDVVARFTGPNHGPSQQTLSQVVSGIASTTTLSSSANPAQLGALVTFTAAVAADDAVPEGTVAFAADGSVIAGCGAAALADGTATCSTAVLGEGDHVVRATYSGDSRHEPSSDELTQTIVVERALSVEDLLVGEANGPALVAVRLSHPATGVVTARFHTSDGTDEFAAVTPEDYGAVSGEVTFEPGETLTYVEIPIVNDERCEFDETFTLTLTDVDGVDPGRTTATITITNDDEVPTIVAHPAVVGEGAESATVQVTLSTATGRPVTVDWQTNDVTAASPGDFVANSGTLTFAPDQTTAVAVIEVVDDEVEEQSETFAVDLSSPTNAFIDQGHAEVMIVDDDAPSAEPGLRVDDIVVIEDAGSVTVPVFLTAPSAAHVTVVATTVDGSAVTPDDYASTSVTLDFPPGSVTPTNPLTIPIVDDDITEGSEELTVSLSDGVGADVVRSPGTVTIVDDDGPPVVIVDDASTSEGSGAASVRIRLSKSTSIPVTVAYATSDSSALAPGDYASTTGSVEFAPGGPTEHVVPIPIVDDSIPEADEVFELEILDAGGLDVARARAEVTIRDDDARPELSVSDVTVIESADAALVTVTMSRPSSRAVGVTFATEDETATADEDYEAVCCPVAFEPGGPLTQTVAVPLIDDLVDEPDETILVRLIDPIGGSLGRSEGRVTIIDDDEPLVVALEVTPAEATIERGASQQLTATATYADGTSADVTDVVAWESSSPDVAVVGADGLVEGLAGGTSTVTARWEDVSSSALLTVTATGSSLVADPALIRLRPFQLPLFTLRARLGDAASGMPISGATVIMRSGSTELCRAVTNTNGVASCNAILSLLSILLANGYVATFEGTAVHAPSSATAPLIG